MEYWKTHHSEKENEVKLVEEKEVKGEKTKIYEMKSIEKEIIENNIRSKNK